VVVMKAAAREASGVEASVKSPSLAPWDDTPPGASASSRSPAEEKEAAVARDGAAALLASGAGSDAGASAELRRAQVPGKGDGALDSVIASVPSGALQYAADRDIKGLVLRLLASARKEIRITMYCFGEKEVCAQLASFMNGGPLGESGRTVRVILDQAQALSPSTGIQPEQVKMLREWRCQFKVHTPTGGGGRYACMHEKSMIVDSETFMLGSANMTDNAYSNSSEVVVTIKDAGIVTLAIERFERLWLEASDHTPDDGVRLRVHSPEPDRRSGFAGKCGQRRASSSRPGSWTRAPTAPPSVRAAPDGPGGHK
jgi:phosphatidylserine/phosphatidylglycerophosphate/cardiolipin synthase-like enzyme